MQFSKTPTADVHFAQRREPIHIGFLLLPGFSVLDFATATEVLHAANTALGREAYRSTIVSTHGQPIASSIGITLAPQNHDPVTMEFEFLFVCADTELDPTLTRDAAKVLRTLERQGCKLGALGTGTFLLAAAGVIRQRLCTIHWQSSPLMQERHPETRLVRRVFVAKDGLYTCPGGTAVTDLFVYILSQHQGQAIKSVLAELLQIEHIRNQDEEYPSTPLPSLGCRPRKLQSAIRQMEAALEIPESPSLIASRIGITTRHLQRLFQSHTGGSPARFYMALRLKQAHLLLQKTRMPILEVAAAVGFSSHSHFSKRYRERYGVTPVQQRQTL
jgi:transcriptional regulator GlxA family with amidase domain